MLKRLLCFCGHSVYRDHTARIPAGADQWLKCKIRGEGTVHQLWAKMGPQQVVRDSFFMKFEVWERWISITGGAGTAFPCVQMQL